MERLKQSDDWKCFWDTWPTQEPEPVPNLQADEEDVFHHTNPDHPPCNDSLMSGSGDETHEAIPHTSTPDLHSASAVSLSRHEYLGEEIILIMPNKKPKLAPVQHGEHQKHTPSSVPATTLHDRLAQVDMHQVGSCDAPKSIHVRFQTVLKTVDRSRFCK